MKKLNLIFLVLALFLMLALVYSAKAQKRFIARVLYKNGTVVGGQLLRASRDSLIILKGRRLLHISVVASEIKRIKIRRKRSIGQGAALGAMAGALVGGLIGYASYTPPDCRKSFLCIDFGPGPEAAVGAVLGGMLGAALGTAVGAAGKRFKIDGHQDQYDLFANEFTKMKLPLNSK
jgi:hypothetical protein